MDTYLNLVVIRAANMERSAKFYELLDLSFTKHSHGSRPEHYACELGNLVFEIYPREKDGEPTSATRIGFRVSHLDQIIEKLEKSGAKIVSPAKDSPWGRRAVVSDPDGHRVELTEQPA